MNSNEKKNEGGKPEQNPGNGPKYYVNIEGKDFPWDKDTITSEEIIHLGGLNAADGVIEINLQDQTEITLQPGQVIELKPGFGFGKKVKFKRG